MAASQTPKRDFWKRTPAIALILASALLIAAVAIGVCGGRSYKMQKFKEVTVQAQILGSTVTAALIFMDREAAHEYVSALRANPEIQAAAVYDSQYALFASYTRGADVVTPPQTIAPSPLHTEDDRVVIAMPVMQDGKTIGTVYLQAVTEPFARRIERYGVLRC